MESTAANQQKKYYISAYPSLSLSNLHEEDVADAKELQDGNIASCSDDNTLKVWSRTGQWLQTIIAPNGFNCFIELKNQQLVTGGVDGSISVWDRNNSSFLYSFKNTHATCVCTMRLLKNNTLATGAEGVIKIWNVERGECTQTLESHKGWVRSIRELRDGSLASVSDEKKFNLWGVTKYQEYLLQNTIYGHNDLIRCVIELKSGLLATSSNDRTIRLWDRNLVICVRILKGHTDAIITILEIEDGIIMSGGTSDNTIRVWSENTGECLKIFNIAMRVVRIVLLKDGSLMYDAGRENKIEVRKCWRSNITLVEQCCSAVVKLFSLEEIQKILPSELYEICTKTVSETGE